jgi:hypothetical protein
VAIVLAIAWYIKVELLQTKQLPQYMRGHHCPKEWGRHLLHYHDGRFLKDQMFSLFVFNSIECHENNRQGSYFFSSGKFLGQNPPTIEQLK